MKFEGIIMQTKHWFKDHKEYWGGFLLIVLAQAALTTYQTPATWNRISTFFIFSGAYIVINLFVAGVIMLLTWPVRKDFAFSRFIKILIAFAAVYGISQLISVLVVHFKG